MAFLWFCLLNLLLLFLNTLERCAHSHRSSVSLGDWCSRHDLFTKLITIDNPVGLLCYSFDPLVSVNAALRAVNSFEEVIFAENFQGLVTRHLLDFLICVDLSLLTKHGSKLEDGLGGEFAHLSKGRLKVLVCGRNFSQFIVAAFLKNAIKGPGLHVVLTLTNKNRKHTK